MSLPLRMAAWTGLGRGWVAVFLVGVTVWGCRTTGHPRTVLDFAPGYNYIASDSVFRPDRHEAGVTARLAHDEGDGLVAGLVLGMLHGESSSDVPSSYAMATVSPYFGVTGRSVGFEFGLNLWLGGGSEELRLLPAPWVVAKFGPQETAWFEAILGQERGVFDGLFGSAGVGIRLGERKNALLRAGIGMGFRFVPDSSPFQGARLEPEVADFPLAGMVELTWTGDNGLGLYTRVVAAQHSTFVIGIALDMRVLSGADAYD